MPEVLFVCCFCVAYEVVYSAVINFVKFMPSVLRHCWLGGGNGIRPVKISVVRYWRGYLSGMRCK